MKIRSTPYVRLRFEKGIPGWLELGKGPHAFKKRGVSLFEMLTVIMILAVVVGIALTVIGDTDAIVNITKNKRNAQTLASTFAAASAVGVEFYQGGDIDQTIANVVEGETAEKGSFAGEFFGLPGIPPPDQAGARAYLKLNNGMLVYNEEGP